MKALSIRGPWWWFILRDEPWRKDVENRDWRYKCDFRGNLLIHASKTMTVKEFDAAIEFAIGAGALLLPRYDDLKRGGIVGRVRVTHHVTAHKSPWFVGPTALVMDRPYPLPFKPCNGALGFFEVGDVFV